MPKKSLQHIDSLVEKELHTSLYNVVSDLASPKEVKYFFEHFFGPAELSMFAKRLAIAVLLEKQQSYETIKTLLKVSSATISTVEKHTHAKGMKLAMQKVRINAWADTWSKKLMKFFRIQSEQTHS